MADQDNEEERLRVVALRNAQSILQARRRAEEALQKQSEWFQITLASIGDAVISTDEQGRITLMNGVAEFLTGWRQAEAIGRPLTDILSIVNEYTRQPVENPAVRALRDKTTVGLANHTVLISKDGSERLIDDSAAPIRGDSGSAIGAVMVFRDVTERKRAEEAQARLAAIVESSDDAIVSKTLEGIILSWNRGAERLFGYTPPEAVGRPITLIIPPDRLDEESEILARIVNGERVDHFETVRVAKDGRQIDISLTISPVRDRSGRIVGASKIARDVSDRKRAEQALREADRRKDEFIALLAHELRNPLAPLRNGMQVMRLAANDPNAVAQARGMMERQLGHMVRLIDDLLDISRIGQNKMELRRSRVLLSDVISSAVETARPLIEAAGQELTVSLPQMPIHLNADLTRLAQVFSNLLTNSAKYTDRGGQIRLTAERQGDDAVVCVRDNGIGIPADALPRIFDMFAQVNRGIERSSGGLGIGLALVKGLVDMHEGTVTAASDGLGMGSMFTVRLPALNERDQPLVAAPIESGKYAGPKRRILVVDDNRDSANSMAMMLKLLGNEVATAYDGAEAVEAVDEFHPKVILMDVGMPRLNGYDATRQIRKKPSGNSVIIIALTGWGQPGDRSLSKAAGCDGHLVKPVSLPDLEKLLTELEAEASNAGSEPQ
jgi:PAS domain S-box-containing protein